MSLNKAEELYKASLPAFFSNEIESDKIILTLSVGAIGFYSALLTGNSLKLTGIMLVLMGLAVLLYGVTIAMVIGVFVQNKKLLLSIIEGDGESDENPHLTFLDKYKYMPFIGAVIFSIVFMLVLMFDNFNRNEVKASKPKPTVEQTVQTADKTSTKKIDINTSVKDKNSTDRNHSIKLIIGKVNESK